MKVPFKGLLMASVFIQLIALQSCKQTGNQSKLEKTINAKTGNVFGFIQGTSKDGESFYQFITCEDEANFDQESVNFAKKVYGNEDVNARSNCDRKFFILDKNTMTNVISDLAHKKEDSTMESFVFNLFGWTLSSNPDNDDRTRGISGEIFRLSQKKAVTEKSLKEAVLTTKEAEQVLKPGLYDLVQTNILDSLEVVTGMLQDSRPKISDLERYFAFKGLKHVLTSNCLEGLRMRGFSTDTPKNDVAYRGCVFGMERIFKFLNVDMDTTADAKYKYIVSFEDELLDMMENEKDITYLTRLKQALEKARTSNEKINLWEWTLKNSPTFEKALQRVAVFFQDHQGMSHVKALGNKHFDHNSGKIVNGMDFTKRIALLKDVQPVNGPWDKINNGVSMTKYKFQDIGILVPSFYHMFVPAYLSLKIKKNPVFIPASAGRNAKDLVSSKTPFIFNSTYEFFQMIGKCTPDLNTDTNFKKMKAFKTPKTIKDLEVCDYGLKDTYMGYYAIYFAAEKTREAMSFDEFKREFIKDPNRFFDKFFKTKI